MRETHAGTHVRHEANISFSLTFHITVLTLMDFIFTCNLTNQPSGHLTQVYNSQEWNVIDPFKSQYMDTTSPAARKTIARIHIFPALFNYWSGVGQVINDSTMKLQATVHLIL